MPLSVDAATEALPLRRAFTAIDSSVRCAITAASADCLRISSAATASCSMIATQPRGAEIAQRGLDIVLPRKMQPRKSALDHGRRRRALGHGELALCSSAAWRWAAEMIMPG